MTSRLVMKPIPTGGPVILTLNNYPTEPLEPEEARVRFYDIMLGEHQDVFDYYEIGGTDRRRDMWAQCPLKRICRDEGSLGLSMDYRYFPEPLRTERREELRVIDFPELKCAHAMNLLGAMSDQLGEIVGRSLKEIQQLIPPIRSINTMQSGISCQKLMGPMLGRYLVIAISMPYFDIGMIPDRLVESLTVSEYSRLGMGLLPIRDTDGERKQGVLVHQAWFLVFNNDMIAMFRSAEDRHRVSTTDEKPPSPIPSYRKRSGAFSMVVDMIESVFTASRKRCLAFLHQEVKQSRIQALPYPKQSATHDELIADTMTIKGIVESQITIFDHLRDLYIATPGWEDSEQIQFAAKRIDKLVLESQRFRQKLDELCGGAERSLKSLYKTMKHDALQNTTAVICAAIHDQTVCLSETGASIGMMLHSHAPIESTGMFKRLRHLKPAPILSVVPVGDSVESRLPSPVPNPTGLSVNSWPSTHKLGSDLRPDIETRSLLEAILEATNTHSLKFLKAMEFQTKYFSKFVDTQTGELKAATMDHGEMLMSATMSQTEDLRKCIDSQTETLKTAIQRGAGETTAATATQTTDLKAAMGKHTGEFTISTIAQTETLTAAAVIRAANLNVAIENQTSELKKAATKQTNDLKVGMEKQTTLLNKAVATQTSTLEVKTEKHTKNLTKSTSAQTEALKIALRGRTREVTAAMVVQTADLKSAIENHTGELRDAIVTQTGCLGVAINKQTVLMSTTRTQIGELRAEMNSQSNMSPNDVHTKPIHHEMPKHAEAEPVTHTEKQDVPIPEAPPTTSFEIDKYISAGALAMKLAQVLKEATDDQTRELIKATGTQTAEIKTAMKRQSKEYTTTTMTHTGELVRATTTQTGIIQMAMKRQTEELKLITTAQTGKIQTAVERQTGEVKKTVSAQTAKIQKVLEKQTEGLKTATGTQTGKIKIVVEKQTEGLRAAIEKQVGKMKTNTDRQTQEMRTGSGVQTGNIRTAIETQTKALKFAIEEQTTKIQTTTADLTTELISTMDKQTTKIQTATTDLTTAQSAVLKKVMTEPMSVSQVQSIKEIATAQAKVTATAIEEQTTEMEKQRRVISAFTVLTTLFLPLGFCATYFGSMNDSGYLNTRERHATFWKWSGGATAFIILITTCVVWRSRALAASGSANPIPIIRIRIKKLKDRFMPSNTGQGFLPTHVIWYPGYAQQSDLPEARVGGTQANTASESGRAVTRRAASSEGNRIIPGVDVGGGGVFVVNSV